MKKPSITTTLLFLILTSFILPDSSFAQPSKMITESPDYILDRALSLYFEQKYIESEKMFLRYLENNQANEVVYRYLAEINIRKNRIETAKKYLNEAIKIKNDDLSSLLLLGNLQVRSMELDAALKTYNRILEIDEFNENALAIMSYLYTQKKMYREAIAGYKRVILAIKKSSNAAVPLASTYATIGKLYYTIQDNNNASIYMKKAFDKTPSNHSIGIFLARLYNITGKFSESRKVLKIIISENPKDTEAIYLLAEISYIFNLTETRKYINLYNTHAKKHDLLFDAIENELTGKNNDAKKQFNTILKKDSKRLSSHIGLYRIFQKENNQHETMRRSLYISILTQSYSAYNLSREYMQHYLSMLDLTAKEMDFHQKFFLEHYPNLDTNDKNTLNEYKQIENTANSYLKAYMNYGMIMEKLDHPRTSIVYYKRALQYIRQLEKWYAFQLSNDLINAPDYNNRIKNATINKNQLYQNLSWLNHAAPLLQHKTALYYIERAIALSENDPFNYFFKGVILFHCKNTQPEKWAEARRNFEKAIYLIREKRKDIPADYYYYLGMTYEKEGNFEKMEENVSHAINLNSNNSGYLNYLAYMYSQNSRNLEKARKLILRALMIEPENPAYLDSYGWIHYKMGNYQKAIHQLNLAADITIKKKENDAVIFYHLAESYYKVKDFPMAQKYYEKTLEYLKNASEELSEKYIQDQIHDIDRNRAEGEK